MLKSDNEEADVFDEGDWREGGRGGEGWRG